MGLDRRKFIRVTTLASATFLPVIRTLARSVAKNTDVDIEKTFNENFYSLDFHFLDKNLLNLHYYFINVQRSCNYLKPIDENKPSFMIVRLPQMHISERGFWKEDWQHKNSPEAHLSGYSYLAFEMWSVHKEVRKGKPEIHKHTDKHLPFSIKNVLDWNNEKYFKLITLVEWFRLKKNKIEEFEFADLVNDCGNFKTKKLWNKQTSGIENYIERSHSELEGFTKYKSIIATLLDGNNGSEFMPVTFFEVPQSLVLVPITRGVDGNLSADVEKRFWDNKLTENDKEHRSYYSKYEIWNNTLFYKTEINEKNTSGQDKYIISAPSFRAIGVISKDLTVCVSERKCEDQTSASRDILPSLLDKVELSFLTQWAKENIKGGNDFTKKDFDIIELNGFFFTGLGIITHLHYYNVENKPSCIDLIEYEHKIIEGRDIFIKVARLGYNTKTGQKYKHVIEGRRRISVKGDEPVDIGKYFPEEATSFIELKQYCECIDKSISYVDLPDQFDSPDNTWEAEMSKSQFQLMSNFQVTPNGITAPAIDDNTLPNYRRCAYQSLTVTEKKRIPIKCLQSHVLDQNICELEHNALWFWPVSEDITSGSGDTLVPLKSYVHCEYEAVDWENKPVKGATPFMFIRASLLECSSDQAFCNTKFDSNYSVSKNLIKAFANYFQGEIDSTGAIEIAQQVFFNRRKTFLYGQSVAFATSLKDSNTTGKKNESRNKPNVLETDFIDTYFVVRNPKYNGQCIPSQKIKYILLPQLLRIKGYSDQLTGRINEKISQVFEPHENYIACKYNTNKDFQHPRTLEVIRNYGTLIMAHTDGFMNRLAPRKINGVQVSFKHVEEKANDKYQEVKDALHNAKDKLGNLVVPDIVPDTISFGTFGITVPKDINNSILQGKTILNKGADTLNRIASFNPRELLRGKLSDVCGLDLTAILDELIPATDDNNQTPLFQLNKLANQVTNDITGSKVYRQIQADINAVKDTISNLQQEYQAIALQINGKEQEFVGYVKQLSDYIPNDDQLNNLVKNIFEQIKVRAFDFALEEIDFNPDEVKSAIDQKVVAIKGFVGQQTMIISAEIQQMQTDFQNILLAIQQEQQVVIDELSKPIFNNLNYKLNELITNNTFKDIIDGYTSFINNDAVYKAFLADRYDLISRTVTLIALKTSAGDDIYLNTETASFEKQGETSQQVKFMGMDIGDVPKSGVLQIQKHLNDLSRLIAKNISGGNFQTAVVQQLQAGYYKACKDAETLFLSSLNGYANDVLGKTIRSITDWLSSFDTLFNQAISDQLSPAAQDACLKIKALIIRISPYVDVLRKIDPYFYYTEQQRLQEVIRDVRSTFTEEYQGACAAINEEIKKQYDNLYIPIYNTYISSIYNLNQQNTDWQKAVGDLAIGSITQQQYNDILTKYNVARDLYSAAKQAYGTNNSNIVNALKDTTKGQILNYIGQLNPELGNQLKNIYDKIYGTNGLLENINKLKQAYIIKYKGYLDYVKSEGGKAEDSIYDAIDNFIADHGDEMELVVEAQNLLKLLTSIRQQDLTYTWSTTSFRDVNLGIVTFKKFSDPATTLKVNVKATTYFTPGKFPSVIERVSTYSENIVSNFGIGFLSILTISFSEVSFVSGSNTPTHFDVKIKDVKFDGALSFVQAFQSWLQTIGKGLILITEPDNVGLGYSLQIPSIQTPGFSFFNLSLNFDLRLYFDTRPMRFGFSLATAEQKFGIAVYIFAGFGFFRIAATPKQGIVEIEAALEAGAWAGISIGPISGEVKLAFGFYYRKNEFGVRIEGYIVAEGRLSVWILEVSARIYLGVISQSSSVEGQCTVTYSVKLGFISRSFSGTFHKTIAGAKSNKADTAEKLAIFHRQQQDYMRSRLAKPKSITQLEAIAELQKLNRLYAVPERSGELPDVKPVTKENWKKFIETF